MFKVKDLKIYDRVIKATIGLNESKENAASADAIQSNYSLYFCFRFFFFFFLSYCKKRKRKTQQNKFFDLFRVKNLSKKI